MANPPWTEVSILPLLDDVPARRDCLIRAAVVTVGEARQINMFPISTEREVVGILELETHGPLDAGDRATVCTNLRIYGNFRDLLDHSERDPLTGLLNRQTFDAAFTTQAPKFSDRNDITSHGRRGHSDASAVWLGVVDIDHFKRMNDTFGHLIGDEVLLLLSRLLRPTFRHHARLYRFGGEEFVVVLDCLGADQASLAFERLRVCAATWSTSCSRRSATSRSARDSHGPASMRRPRRPSPGPTRRCITPRVTGEKQGRVLRRPCPRRSHHRDEYHQRHRTFLTLKRQCLQAGAPARGPAPPACFPCA